MKAILVLLVTIWPFIALVFGLPTNSSDQQNAANPVVTLSTTGTGPTLAQTMASMNEDWQCEYFANSDLSGSPVIVGMRPILTANWGKGAPIPGLPVDGFSMCCVTTRNFPALDNYQFVLRVDGGVRLYVDNALFVNEWFVGNHQRAEDISLSAGPHLLRVEYFDNAGAASLAIDWKKSYDGWEGLYFNNTTTEGAPAYKSDDSSTTLNALVFAAANEPHPNIVADNFSVIWRKRVAFHTDHYRLYLRADGEAQVWINGKLALNTDAQSGQISKDIQLAAGNQLVEVHYVNRQGPARLELRWEQIS